MDTFKNILRFVTAGSVDDGKSTLIGRLLYDSRNVLADQLAALERQSRDRHRDGIDFSLLTDGLRAEREQGITIDLAYKYFYTSKRKFIIIDAPGHIQYTRNMVTGTSNAQLIIILIDLRHGIVEQTQRHAAIAGLLNIPRVVVAINKMDLCGYSAERYNQIVADFGEVARGFKLRSVLFLPMSALQGDNIVTPSQNMPWYEGPPLLTLLEEIEIENGFNQSMGRLPVQYVIRSKARTGAVLRGYAGRINSGIFKKNDIVTLSPCGATSRILSIESAGRDVMEAYADQSVVLRLEDDLDISRGDLLVTGDRPRIGQDLDMLIFWMDEKFMLPGNRYLLQLGSRTLRCLVKDIEYRLDINTMDKRLSPGQASLNDIVRVSIRTGLPVAFDLYAENPDSGRGILVDETSFATVGACIFQ